MTHDPRCPAWDTNLECPHERMPFDPCPSPDGKWSFTLPCGCFLCEEPGYRVPVAEVRALTPKPKVGPLCDCGCGELTSGRRRGGVLVRYVSGHNMKRAA